MKVLKNDSGFSLIEVIIAITLMALIMGSMFDMVDNTTKTKETVTLEDRQYLQVQTALNRMNEDFTQIWSPAYYSAKKENKSDEQEELGSLDDQNANFTGEVVAGAAIPNMEQPDPSTFIFFTSAYRRKVEDAKESRYAWIKYSLKNIDSPNANADPEKASSNPSLIRQVLTSDIYRKELDWDNVRPQVLLSNVKKMSFTVWDPKRKEFVGSLREIPKLEQSSPRAIALELTWVSPAESENVYERIFRPLWPNFDVIKDEKARQKALQPKGKNGQPPSS